MDRRVQRLRRSAVGFDSLRVCGPSGPIVLPPASMSPMWQSPHTSEIPFLCCLRYSVVHAIRLGFLR